MRTQLRSLTEKFGSVIKPLKTQPSIRTVVLTLAKKVTVKEILNQHIHLHLYLHHDP